MNEKLLLQIARKLKDVRKINGLTVQAVAERADVSKGLISKIENGRTIPSLPVLLSIIGGLETNAEDFFHGFGNGEPHQDVRVIKKSEYDPFEKEEAEGFFYHHITTTEIDKLTLECVMLTLKPGAKREKVVTDAYEYKYILSGNVTYLIGEDEYELEAGDSLYFNGRIPHVPENRGTEDTVMLIVYLFDHSPS
ncbi:helix-turn-helix domain-containing protein [Owenweeksia hongkongensis]|uniref:helix-turn-helix domain-containing protein n=1 Tax=Owenweeksia hongkongensis TaxID=253245 RepID=UPI003A932C5A